VAAKTRTFLSSAGRVGLCWAKMRSVFSGDVSDEARRNIRTIGDELAKSEAVTQENLGRSLMSVNLRGRRSDRSWGQRKSVPKGPGESSPVRSAGLAFLKSDPSRTGRLTNPGKRYGARGTKRQTFLSSLAGRTCLFASFPSTSYWATFKRPGGTDFL
jgi:hypothetical protein